MKREVTGRDFAGALDAVLRDCIMNYPMSLLEFKRDSKRLHQASSSRGIWFFTRDLPSLADFLYGSLAKERLVDGKRPAFGQARSKDDTRPKFLWALWSRIFNDDGFLLDNPDPTAIFLLSTLTQCWKKVEIDCDPTLRKAEYAEYYRVDEKLPPAPEFWGGEPVSSTGFGSLSDFSREGGLEGPEDFDFRRVLETCQRTADILVTGLGVISPDDIRGKHGPGAVSDQKRAGDKYAFPSWPARLDVLFPFDYHGSLNSEPGVNNLGETIDASWAAEPNSYLTDVPKTAKGPRLIAEEPVCHQWIQQGIADLFRRAVAKSRLGVMIDFFDQKPSQEACRKASLEGKYATIDLSAASDRLSCSVVQRIFRRHPLLLEQMARCRTRFIKQDQYEDLPKLHKLRKFASMGSALTFPVQSVVFATIAAGVGLALQPTRHVDDVCAEVRVFGDDIIVPVDWVDCLGRVLSGLGLKVNMDKSFSTGRIRESCGLHAWGGYTITPFRLRHVFSRTNGASHLSWVQASSNAHLMGLWHTSKYLEEMVTHSGRRFACVRPEAPQVGLTTFSSGIEPGQKTVWNRDLQRAEISAWAYEIVSTTKEARIGVNNLLRLGRADYVSRLTLADLLDIPRERGIHELLEVVDGPARLVRVRVPVELIVA